MWKCTGQSLSVHTHTWARGETRFKCAHSLWARAAYIRERASGFVQEQRKSAQEQRKSARQQGDSCASREIRARAKEIRVSREICAQAGRFALAHYINLLSRYKNVLSTFGSKITPYKGWLEGAEGHIRRGAPCTAPGVIALRVRVAAGSTSLHI